MANQRRSAVAMALLLVAMVTVVMETRVSARHVSSVAGRAARRSPPGQAPGVKRSDEKVKVGVTKTYSYQMERPEDCAEDDDLFADCYLCGKLMEDVRVYRGCCERQTLIVEFCEKLLT